LFGSAGNFGAVQRRLAARFRTVALDLRNHGESPHEPEMGYPAMAGDVLETLRARDMLPARLVGHSMGGKVAMAAALAAPSEVTALVVVDIAPVRYPPGFRAYADAMARLPLTPGLTRATANAGLAEAVPDPGVRAFLLQNLRLGDRPRWRIGLREIMAALPGIEGWEGGGRYDGPALFVSGAASDYVKAEHRPAIRALFPAARFVTVKSAGHWVHAENPEGFIAVLDAFLQ
jgi:esterase